MKKNNGTPKPKKQAAIRVYPSLPEKYNLWRDVPDSIIVLTDMQFYEDLLKLLNGENPKKIVYKYAVKNTPRQIIFGIYQL